MADSASAGTPAGAPLTRLPTWDELNSGSAPASGDTVVQLPSGQVWSFPAGTPQDAIMKALRTAHPLPLDTGNPLRPWEQAGSALVEGLTGAMGLPGDLEELGARGLSALGVPMGTPVDRSGTLPTIFARSGQLLDLTNQLGLTNNYSLRPANRTESLVTGAERGIGAALPFALGGAPAAAATELYSGAGGGFGGELFNELAPNSPTAQLAGGIIGGYAGGNAARGTQRIVNALTGRWGPTGAQYATAGIPMRSAGLTSNSPLTKWAFGPVADIPQAESDIQQALGQTAGRLGQSVTLQEAGQYAQNRFRDWATNVLPAKEAAAWAPVDAKIPASTPTPIFGFNGALKAITGDAGVLQAFRQEILPRLPARLQGLMSTALDNPAGILPKPAVYAPHPTLLGPNGKPLQVMTSPAQPGIPVTWSDARSLRTAIGDAIGDPSIKPDIGTQDLKQLYAALTDDLRGTANAQGASKEFAAANAESTRLHSFNDNIIANGISGKNPAQESIPPESAAGYFLAPGRMKRGASELATLSTELPDVTSELAAAKVRQMAGLADPSSAPEKVAKSFSSAWEAMSPEAKAALVPSSPIRAQLDSAYKIAKRVATQRVASSAEAPLLGLFGLGLGGGLGTLYGHYIAQSPYADLLPAAWGEVASGIIGSGAGIARGSLGNSSALARYAATARPNALLAPSLMGAQAAGGYNLLTGEGGQ